MRDKERKLRVVVVVVGAWGILWEGRGVVAAVPCDV
jgi:hypothetical protein